MVFTPAIGGMLENFSAFFQKFPVRTLKYRGGLADISFSQGWRIEMKVYDRNQAGAASAGAALAPDVQKTGSNPSGGAQSSHRNAAGDQVALSGTLGRLSQALSAQGNQGAARVAALTSEYRSGNYQPNAAGTARGLVSEALSGAGGQSA
jgi:hypothetical protein